MSRHERDLGNSCLSSSQNSSDTIEAGATVAVQSHWRQRAKHDWSKTRPVATLNQVHITGLELHLPPTLAYPLGTAQVPALQPGQGRSCIPVPGTKPNGDPQGGTGT